MEYLSISMSSSAVEDAERNCFNGNFAVGFSISDSVCFFFSLAESIIYSALS